MKNNSTPEISLNKLDEIRLASEKGKVNLFRGFKFRTDKFKSSQYNSVKSILSAYLIDPDHNISVFESGRKRIASRKRNTDWQIRDVANSILALKKIEADIEKIFSKYFKYKMVRNNLKSTIRIRDRRIKGVIVHMNPEVLLFRKDSNEIAGVVKFVFTKGKKITPMKGQIICGFIKEYVEKQLKIPTEAINFLAFDVFHRHVVTAPSDFALHKKEINKAVSEINLLWPKVEKK